MYIIQMATFSTSIKSFSHVQHQRIKSFTSLARHRQKNHNYYFSMNYKYYADDSCSSVKDMALACISSALISQYNKLSFQYWEEPSCVIEQLIDRRFCCMDSMLTIQNIRSTVLSFLSLLLLYEIVDIDFVVASLELTRNPRLCIFRVFCHFSDMVCHHSVDIPGIS